LLSACHEVGSEENMTSFVINGVVVPGDGRGRQLGFPTANVLCTSPDILPADGVYAGWLKVGDKLMPAALSVGINSTFDGAERRLEVHVIDRGGLELYARSVQVIVGAYLRPMRRFADAGELVEQIKCDVDRARMLTSLPRVGPGPGPMPRSLCA
jgi:riboflavin kinase/FMN adenylyltransferase